MYFNSYLKSFSISAVIIVILIVGFNRLINPYAIYDGPLIKGINEKKPVISRYLRMSKAGIIRNFQPSSIILGTSKGELGIDPSHPGWILKPVYNLSFSGANLYESYRYLQHANKVSPLKQVLLLLEFEMFNASANHNSVDFSEDRLAVNYYNQSNPFYYLSDSVETLFSLDAIIDSFKTILNQKSNVLYFDNGLRNDYTKLMILRKNGDRLPAFNQKNNANELYAFQSHHLDNWEIFNKFLSFARSQKIDLILAISPQSEYDYNKIASSIGLEKFEYWKEQLVNINEKVANEYNEPPFTLWDFSDINSFNFTNNWRVSIEENNHSIQWFLDSAHFKRELGDIILDKIFEYSYPDRKEYGDFGVLLSRKIPTNS
jgi:hypothetical protein